MDHQKSSYQARSNEPLYVERTTELPEVDPPTSDEHPKYFKVKTRATEEYLNVQIGLMVVEYKQYQEDFITYLSNMLMCECEFLNVSIVDPMYLYISMNATAENNRTGDFDYLDLESKLYGLLEFCRNKISQFLRQYTSENAIFKEDDTDSKKIIKGFQEKCIKPINNMHRKIFSQDQ